MVTGGRPYFASIFLIEDGRRAINTFPPHREHIGGASLFPSNLSPHAMHLKQTMPTAISRDILNGMDGNFPVLWWLTVSPLPAIFKCRCKESCPFFLMGCEKI